MILDQNELNESTVLTNLITLLNSRSLDYFKLPSLKKLIEEAEDARFKIFIKARLRTMKYSRPDGLLKCGSCGDMVFDPADHVCDPKKKETHKTAEELNSGEPQGLYVCGTCKVIVSGPHDCKPKEE